MILDWTESRQSDEDLEKLTADQFVSILKDHLPPSLEESGIPKEQIIFQQDNDPKHTQVKEGQELDGKQQSHSPWLACAVSRPESY